MRLWCVSSRVQLSAAVLWKTKKSVLATHFWPIKETSAPTWLFSIRPQSESLQYNPAAAYLHSSKRAEAQTADLNWLSWVRSRWIVALSVCQAGYQCFPECPGVSFYPPYKSRTQYRIIDHTFIRCISCFISLLSPGSHTKHHLPPQRAQSRRLVPHHHRSETEDGTSEWS